MSLAVGEKVSLRVRGAVELTVKPSREIIVVEAGESAVVLLHIASSQYGRRTVLYVDGLEQGIARYVLSPVQGKTPFTSRLTIITSPNVMGIYPFQVTARDYYSSSISSTTNLVLVILPRNPPLFHVSIKVLQEILRNVETLLSLYNSYGIQYIIWYILARICREEGLRFSGIKAIYELFEKKELSNGTIGDLLKRMEKKGLIVKVNNRYYAGIDDEKLVKQAIDAKRVKAGWEGAKQLLQAASSNNSARVGYERNGEYIPIRVRRVLDEAKKLLEKGEREKALGLLQHTVIGARRTGRWVAWVGDYFIYLESKAKPIFHYFRSRKLATVLSNMGLREGFINAAPVDDLIRDLFLESYREARRIHYLLKELNWLQYGPPLILYIAVYPDKTGGFRLETIHNEVVAEVNYKPQEATEIRKHLVMPEEHVDKDNDETYFRYR